MPLTPEQIEAVKDLARRYAHFELESHIINSITALVEPLQKELDSCESKLRQCEADCAFLRSVVKELEWRGDGPKQEDYFYCLFCHSCSETSDTIEHLDECLVSKSLQLNSGQSLLDELVALKNQVCAIKGIQSKEQLEQSQELERYKKALERYAHDGSYRGETAREALNPPD